MLLARIDVEWRVEEREEAGTRGDVGIVGRGVGKEAREGRQRELGETASKGKVLVA